jgi:hypothetical protein
MSRSGWRRRWGWRDDCGALDYVEFGEAFVEVGLAGFFDLVLIDAGVVAVLVVKHFDDFHAVGVDGAKGGEAGFVEEGVVLEIDEDLRGAGVRAGGGEDDGALFVGLSDGIVFEFGLFPDGADGGIRADAELRDEIGDGAEDDGVVVEVMLHEIVEAIGAERRPCASDGDREVAAGRDEFDDVDVGSFVFKQRWVKEHTVVGGVRRGGGSCGLFRSGRAAL